MVLAPELSDLTVLRIDRPGLCSLLHTILSYLWMWGLISPHIHTSIRRRERDRGREAWTRFRHLLSPEFTICHVKLQTCQSQDFLQFYFQGQIVRRGDPTAGEHFPSPTTLPLKKSQRGGGSKDQIIVPFSQLHPLTHSEPGLQLAF